MGITSFLFPQESSAGQPQHDGTNDEPEGSDSLRHAVRSLCARWPCLPAALPMIRRSYEGKSPS